VADTEENATHFSRPGVNEGERSTFPQARVVGLLECGTHAVLDAVVGHLGHPGFGGGSGYWIPTSCWSVCWAA